MLRLFLFGPPDASPAGSIFLNVTGPAADGSVSPVSLQLPTGPALNLNVPASSTIPAANIAPLAGGAAGDLRLQNGPALDLSIPVSIPAATQWFNIQFAGAVTGELALSIPGSAAKPFAAIRACGAFSFASGPVIFTSRPFCFEVSMPDLPADPLHAPAPSLSIRPPHLGIDFPKLSLPWTFPNLPSLPWSLGGFSGKAGTFPLTVSYDSVTVNADGVAQTVTIDVKHLKIASSFGSLDGDLHVVLTTTGIDFASSSFHLYHPDVAHAITIPFSAATLNPGCLVLGWNEPKLHELLALLAPDLGKKEIPVQDVAFRLLTANGSPKELRVDWHKSDTDLSFPGFDINLPSADYSLIARNGSSPRVGLAMGIKNGQVIKANTDFTWFRPDADAPGREVHRPEDAAKNSFVTVTATAQANSTVLLMDLPLGGSSGGPKFFQQLTAPLPVLAGNCTASDLAPVSLHDFKVDVQFNPNALKVPFLQSAENNTPQLLKVKAHTPTVALPVVHTNLDITVTLGSIEMETAVDIDFNLENFAFTIHDDNGLQLKLKKKVDGDLFGLHWNIHSKAGQEDGFEVLRLVTKDSNFQLKQGADAVFQLEFSKATAKGSPIIFQVTNLVIGPKGVDLDASVQAKPARLQGVDTEFVFAQGTFQIRQNRLVDFTIAGSGPLPPALVGSATASIALQFHQNASSDIELVSAAAKLEGKNLLHCQGTRFKFAVEALGLKYVQDGGTYHLYFTITGSAKFTPIDSDDSSGPLAWLPQIELRLMECPLTGDARVISKHVQFLIEMPRKLKFSILGCFEMEVRAIGFVPQADMFDAFASAMRISGQIKFAEGGGDALDARIDFHDLFIGLPEPGSILPRIYCKELGVKLKAAGAFELNGMVDFLNNEEIQPGVIASGFRGQGTISIQGLPTLSGSFAFLRVRDANGTEWKRAWFLYLQIEKASFQIPVVEIFLREIGLGFGYRYTLAMIKESDNIQDPKQLLKKLKELSVSQGELGSFDQWRVDIGGSDDPRWTVVLRALISETSATEVPTEWLDAEEHELPCLFLLDAVIALRSDLTFLMTARGWLNTNYWDYVNDTNGVRRAPLVTGFVLLSPRQKRFLAHVGSNSNAAFGDHPPIPDFLKDAIRGSYFTATLLVEPGLIHYELGWPNMLGWTASIGPLTGEFRGGSIFRVSTTEIVVGVSYQARASLDIEAGFDAGFIGASLTAHASVAYGTRYIGVVGLVDPVQNSAFYAVEGIDIRVAVSIKFWIKIDLLFGTIELDFDFSFDIAITASVQVALLLKSPYAGIRGSATVSLRIMGHGLNFGITIAANADAVTEARRITDAFLNIGLESTDVPPLPGEPQLGDKPGTPMNQALAAPAASPAPLVVAPAAGAAGPVVAAPLVAAPAVAAVSPAVPVAVIPAGGPDKVRPLGSIAHAKPGTAAPASTPNPVSTFLTPDYTVFAIPPKQKGGDFYFLLLPSANRKDPSGRLGFLPTPPDKDIVVGADFHWTPDVAIPGLQQWSPAAKDFKDAKSEWAADWSTVGKVKIPNTPDKVITLADMLRYAYTLRNSPAGTPQDTTPISDPIWPNHDQPLSDDRVQNPADSNYTAAVRAARDQVLSPRFKTDPYSPFEREMSQAWSFGTSVFQTDGSDQGTESTVPQAVHLRSSVIQQMVRDVSNYAAAAKKPDPTSVEASVAFRMGLVFKVPEANVPDWLLKGGTGGGTISQRNTTKATRPDTSVSGKVEVFNRHQDRFDQKPPRFDHVRQFADDNTIAIAWDLAWDGQSSGSAQDDPEHHLAYYLVRRRPLDGQDRGVEYKVRPADVLHRAATNDPNQPVPIRLRPRFHVLDHFNHETQAEQAALPPNGRTYLYSITPVDVAGHESPRPLTLTATRLPHQPPLVPADAEVTVAYSVAASLTTTDTPQVNPVARVTVAWTPVSTPPGTPRVPAARYRLLFRREQTLPIGSYGLDSSAQGSQSRGLPVSNARPLRTDVPVQLNRLTPLEDDGREYYEAPFTDATTKGGLTDVGVYPGPDVAWRPDSWRVFLQAESQTGVWSALAPVQVRLSFDNGSKNYTSRPASIEWIAKPVPFSTLPPEDEQASVGYVEVPMPVDAHLDTRVIQYAVHPEKPRGVAFRWNQAASASPVPPALHAGYNVFEFDIDAHRPEKLGDELNSGNLRPIQEIELLPEADLPVTPPDTLHTERWEAWYAATRERIAIARKNHLKTSLSGWYSFRDSKVVWPPLAGTYTPGQIPPGKLPRMHKFLEGVLKKVGIAANPKSAPDGPIVTLTPIRPSVPEKSDAAKPLQTLDHFLQETSISADPYGWRILQRMGLAICFTVRDPKQGPIAGSQTLAWVKKAVDDQLAEAGFGGCKNHVHVELLYQPGQSLQLATAPDPQPGDPGKAAADDALLSAMQISLRPIATQVYFYRFADITVQQPVKDNATATLTFTLTADKPITVIELTAVTSSAASSNETNQFIIDKDSRTRPVPVPKSGKISLLLRSEGFVPNMSEPVSSDLGIVNGGDFDFTDTRGTYFTADESTWFDDRSIWDPLGIYLTMPGVGLPSDIKNHPELLSWLARFLDLSPRTTDAGPYVATAYPRLVSPLPVAPGKDGRISYIQLITDRYAHVFRYYVWPYGRYDALWRAVAQSRVFDQPPTLDLVLPLKPEKGGLDVVLDRVREVASPLVLSSRRIDALTGLAVPAKPGPIWEVIVAKHPEQTLAERNWTLARQLAFRQIAFTMLRTYAFQSARFALDKALGVVSYSYDIQFVENLPADKLLPGPYPAPETERLDPAKSDDLMAIDLPLRLSPFSQGAQVLHYRALPYYYKHRLVLTAQASRVASEPVSVVQTSFEYLSPTPLARSDAKPDSQNPQGQSARARYFQIHLASHWDCLPPASQVQWAIENPSEHDAPTGVKPLRKYSSLPESGVIYQLVLVKEPALTEALVEYFFDEKNQKYDKRQFSKDFIGLAPGLEVPDRATDRQAPIFLTAALWNEEFTREQRDSVIAKLLPPDLSAIQPGTLNVMHRWFPARGVSHTVPLTGALRDAIEFRAADRVVLAWDGNLAADREAWAASVDTGLAASIRSLQKGVPIVINRLLDPSSVSVPRSSLRVEADRVDWSGGTTPALLSSLDSTINALPQKSPGRTALENLRTDLKAPVQNPVTPTVSPAPAPTVADLIALLGLDAAGPLSQALKINADAAGNWSLAITGLNLDRSAGAMLALVEQKIPNPSDVRRVALHAALLPISTFTKSEPIPGVPAALRDHILFAPFLLHPRGAVDSAALLALYAGSQPDLDSIQRLLGDSQITAGPNAQLAQWSAQHAVSSSAAFSADIATLAEPGRVEFLTPDACVLEIFGDLNDTERGQLNTAADNAVGDPGFASALRRLAAGEKTVRAPLGFEQIAEISPSAVLSAGPPATLVWRGPVSPEQRLTIQGWASIPAVGSVFQSLLDQFAAFHHSETFDGSEEWPRENELPRELVGHLIVTSGTANWAGQDLDAAQLAALNTLAADTNFGATFRAALQRIVNAIQTSQGAPILLPAGWKPRPVTGGALLPDKLLIGNALMQFHGVMSRAEAGKLSNGLTKPDGGAIAKLFSDSQSAGLNGAAIQIRARLGSAAASKLTAIDNKLA